jgi:hypothetical protein
LDYLAWQFVHDGWSIKKLHRLIMLSSVYQQTSDDNPAYQQIDANNTWLWRMPRIRLDFEAARDTLLAISGRLDCTAGGHPVDIAAPPFAPRRTIYGFVERQNLPGLFRTFDFASPDTTSPQRFQTTVPQQALFMLNSPFVIQQARFLAQRPEVACEGDEADRIEALYRLALQRAPAIDELRLAHRFLASQTNLPPCEIETPAWQYGYGEFDETAGRILNFALLPHFAKNAWQGGEALPDEKLGWVMLNKDGGHVGNDLQHSAIRRWVAPRAGLISIDGTLKHESEKGDGVRGRIVSSRRGELGQWIVHNKKESAKIERFEVERGETIDFVTDCYKTVDSDSFLWAPVIKMISGATGSSGNSDTEWSAKADFSGPKEPSRPLTAWEKYAQVLLMSNELVFVD